MITLKACPFCGSIEVVIAYDDNHYEYYIYCEECDARGPWHNDAASATGAWNKRKECK